MPGRLVMKAAQHRRLKLRGVSSAAATMAPKRVPAKRPVIGRGKAVVLEDPGLLLRVRLPVRLTNGNSGRGFSFWGTARFRKEIGDLLIGWGFKRVPFEFPVRVHLIRVLAKREHAWDSANWQLGNWKQIQDALTNRNKGAVAYAGWFHDDSPRWITATTFANETTERPAEGAIIIEVRKS